MKSVVALSMPDAGADENIFARLRSKIARRLKTGLYARHFSFGLRRDLDVEFAAPAAKIPISVRELSDADLPVLFPTDQSHLDEGDRLELSWRKAFLDSGFTRCFVAVDERNGEPCYFQWLIGPEQNAQLAPLKQFHRLADDEALLENAFTPKHYRGMGIMPAAMARIAERARDHGLRYVTTFVGDENIPSLKGCARAGFSPHLVRYQTNLAYDTIRLLRVEEMPAGDPRRNLTF